MARFQVLTTASMKNWNIVPCSIVEVDRSFRGVYYIHHEGDDNRPDEAERTSETLLYIYETTWRYIPEGFHLQADSRLGSNDQHSVSKLLIFRKFYMKAMLL
jgi:hypothetical protein